MATSNIQVPDRSNGHQRCVADRTHGHLSRKDRTYAFGPIAPPPKIADVAMKGLRHWCHVSGVQKRDPLADLMRVNEKSTLVTRSGKHQVTPGEHDPVLTDCVRRTLADPKEQALFDKADAIMEKMEGELAVAKKKHGVSTSPSKTEDPLKGYDNVMDELRKEMGRRAALIEREAGRLLEQLKSNHRQVEEISHFQQKLTLMLTAEGSNGFVDFTNNEEMQALVKKMAEYGILLPEGTKWDEKQVATAKANLDMGKTNKLHTGKEFQAETQRFQEMINTVQLLRAAFLTRQSDTAHRIIDGIRGRG